MKNQAIYRVLVFCFFSLYIYGCSLPNHYVRPNANIDAIKRIAVLPFESLTADVYAGEKIRRVVLIELMSRGFDVVEPGEVTRTLNDLKIKAIGTIRISDIQSIGKTLGADAVMTGSVDAYGISRGITVQYPEVAINLRLYDTNTGNVVWTVRHNSGGPSFWTRHFGAEGISLSETAEKVVKEAINTLHGDFPDIESFSKEI